MQELDSISQEYMDVISDLSSRNYNLSRRIRKLQKDAATIKVKNGHYEAAYKNLQRKVALFCKQALSITDR